MSFFGLTALGPQNDFTAHSAKVTHLMVFEDEDCEKVWKQFAVDPNFALTKNIPDMMRKLYCGPVPTNDAVKIEEAFAKYTDSETLTFYEFISTMQMLRRDAEEFERTKPADTDFNSVTELHAAMRGMKMPKDSFFKTKQTTALTSMQEYGWHDGKLERPQHYRKGSDLTKFAAELIKNGVY